MLSEAPMPWLILAVLALGGLYLYGQQQQKPQPPAPPQPGPLPPGPPSPPAPGPSPSPNPSPSPASGGTVPTTSDGLGGTIVTVAPGDMGTLSMQSAVTSAAALGATGAPSALAVQAPNGGGITNVMSSNVAVIPGNMLSPSNLGQPVPSVVLGPPLTPGKTDLSVSWNDSSGNPIATTIHLTAS